MLELQILVHGSQQQGESSEAMATEALGPAEHGEMLCLVSLLLHLCQWISECQGYQWLNIVMAWNASDP